MQKFPHIFNPIIVHTGQHYDFEMSKIFFQELEIPNPDYNLEIGSFSHAIQTAEIMIKFEKICLKEKPDFVLVVGDVNSTLAASLVAVKLNISVVHVEAGLRSFDYSMPEEINRKLTDVISSFLFTPSIDAEKHLLKEGIDKKKIYFVGNVMIDTLIAMLPKIKKISIPVEISNFIKNYYAVLTLHRPSNVDDGNILSEILSGIEFISRKIPVIFPVHPRTEKQIKKLKLGQYFKNIKIVSPLGYLEYMKLMKEAKLVFTDSGGVQEETTFLGIPCLTLRNNTERPITIKEGTNKLVGTNKKKIIEESFKILNKKYVKRRVPKFWDGNASKRIVKILIKNIVNMKYLLLKK